MQSDPLYTRAQEAATSNLIVFLKEKKYKEISELEIDHFRIIEEPAMLENVYDLFLKEMISRETFEDMVSQNYITPFNIAVMANDWQAVEALVINMDAIPKPETLEALGNPIDIVLRTLQFNIIPHVSRITTELSPSKKEFKFLDSDPKHDDAVTIDAIKILEILVGFGFHAKRLYDDINISSIISGFVTKFGSQEDREETKISLKALLSLALNTAYDDTTHESVVRILDLLGPYESRWLGGIFIDGIQKRLLLGMVCDRDPICTIKPIEKLVGLIKTGVLFSSAQDKKGALDVSLECLLLEDDKNYSRIPFVEIFLDERRRRFGSEFFNIIPNKYDLDDRCDEIMRETIKILVSNGAEKESNNLRPFNIRRLTHVVSAINDPLTLFYSPNIRLPLDKYKDNEAIGERHLKDFLKAVIKNRDIIFDCTIEGLPEEFVSFVNNISKLGYFHNRREMQLLGGIVSKSKMVEEGASEMGDGELKELLTDKRLIMAQRAHVTSLMAGNVAQFIGMDGDHLHELYENSPSKEGRDIFAKSEVTDKLLIDLTESEEWEREIKYVIENNHFVARLYAEVQMELKEERELGPGRIAGGAGAPNTRARVRESDSSIVAFSGRSSTPKTPA